MHIKKQRLLTPGPTPLYPPAMLAMMASDVHHRTEDFRATYLQVIADLKDVLGTSHDVLCFTSSGTGAMDASVSNLFSKGDKVIVCSAGKFGERWAEITQAYGLDVKILQAEYGDAVSVERVQAALAAEPGAKGVFVQASETSTGAQHDVRGMGLAIKRSKALFIVDGITGIGTMPIDIDTWGVDVLIGGSQKAFMIPPGLAFAAVSPKAWEFHAASTLPHYYFDFSKEKKSAAGADPASTPATSLILALGAALAYIKKLGMANLIENAQLLARATREAVQELGLDVFAKSPGSAVTAVRSPKGVDSLLIIKEFRTRFGAIIANGQGSMKGQIFRIAHLGYFDFADLFAVIGGLEIILHAIGQPVRFGAGVAAVQRVYTDAAVPQLTAVKN